MVSDLFFVNEIFPTKNIMFQLTGSLIYKLKGFDPDGDALDFGVQSTYDSDVITVKNLESNEAGIYLEKELDREVID